MKSQRIHIIGAGLAGTLLAILLVRRGHSVRVFEKRPDPRHAGYEGGRSINLALAYRGLHVLQQAGLDAAVMPQTVMMRGRMVHDIDSRQNFLRYGKDDSEVIWSIHRGRLNVALIDAAEAEGVRIEFNAQIRDIDLDAGCFTLQDADGGRVERFERLIGADGAGSAVRQAMVAAGSVNARTESLGHHYKELEIAPADDGGFRLDGNSLHIWPRGGFMCIALPNTERTFTVTLFLPASGETGFDRICSPQDARAFFHAQFPDALALISDFEHDWTHNPESPLSTLYLDRWHHRDRAVLLGDAAHAMVPFHGQGMNCAFEDCLALCDAIEAEADWSAAIARYEQGRQANAEAIQAMALENYIEMRDRVDDAEFLLERALERELAARHPERFVPRYSMVSFRRTPYALALARGQTQREILQTLCAGKSDIAGIDFALASELVHRRLEPLHD
ncbi:MAG: FAD-dependent oxidoreductase [Arenimonas sp.]